jgi:YebC/PmpR family DNA-binding regulatory protein
MAGHNKWSQIKHKKAIIDARKGKAFTKLIKEITVAAKTGGGDPAGNARLRFLLDKAKDINMPQDNYVRAIKKGTGELPGVVYENYTYEGYGPGNTAVMVEVLTDNKNKAVGELRHVFSRNGGNLAESGAVGWMFERQGTIEATHPSMNEDQLIEHLLEYPIKDISKEDGLFFVSCEPKSLEEVKSAMTKLGFTIKEAELEWKAANTIELTSDAEDKAIQLLQALDELDDVQNVYTNLA